MICHPLIYSFHSFFYIINQGMAIKITKNGLGVDPAWIDQEVASGRNFISYFPFCVFLRNRIDSSGLVQFKEFLPRPQAFCHHLPRTDAEPHMDAIGIGCGGDIFFSTSIFSMLAISQEALCGMFLKRSGAIHPSRSPRGPRALWTREIFIQAYWIGNKHLESSNESPAGLVGSMGDRKIHPPSNFPIPHRTNQHRNGWGGGNPEHALVVLILLEHAVNSHERTTPR
jgi:hypothetical protein